jgi:hypothetical protein
MSEFNREIVLGYYNEAGEYLPKDYFDNQENKEAFEQSIETIFNASVQSTVPATTECSQNKDEDINEENKDEDINEENKDEDINEEPNSTGIMTEPENISEESKKNFYNTLVSDILNKLTTKFEKLDLGTKIKIILTRPKLLKTLLISASISGICGRMFLKNPLNIYNNVLGGLSSFIVGYSVLNPDDASEIIRNLNIDNWKEQMKKYEEIEQITDENKKNEKMFTINKEIGDVLKKKNEIESLVKEQKQVILFERIRTTLNEANNLSGSITEVNFLNILGLLYGKSINNDNAKNIIKAINRIWKDNNHDNHDKKMKTIEFLASLEPEKINNDLELTDILNVIMKIEIPEEIGVTRQRGNIGGKRITHKKSKKSKKTTKHTKRAKKNTKRAKKSNKHTKKH